MPKGTYMSHTSSRLGKVRTSDDPNGRHSIPVMGNRFIAVLSGGRRHATDHEPTKWTRTFRRESVCLKRLHSSSDSFCSLSFFDSCPLFCLVVFFAEIVCVYRSYALYKLLGQITISNAIVLTTQFVRCFPCEEGRPTQFTINKDDAKS